MRPFISLLFSLSICSSAVGQRISKADTLETANTIDYWKIREWNTKDYRLPTKWYSETASHGVLIQNSFPKGAAYADPNGNKFG
jgi:hypothetical protein